MLGGLLEKHTEGVVRTRAGRVEKGEWGFVAQDIWAVWET